MKTSWHYIAEKWLAFQSMKISSGDVSDGQPRSKSNPSEQCVLNLNVVVLEIEILDMIKRHCLAVRRRGGKANNLGGLLKEFYPHGAPQPERQAWETYGADFLEEIDMLLGNKPRPWTQHKLDLLAEYPERFNFTQAQTLIVLAGIGIDMPQQTLQSRVKNGTITTQDTGRINLGDVLATPYTPHKTRHAQ